MSDDDLEQDLDERDQNDSDKDDDALDADVVSEVRRPRMMIVEDDPGSEPAIAAEVVQPRVTPATPNDDPLATILRDIPTNTDITIVVKRKADENLTFRMPNNKFGHVCNVHYDGQPLTEVYSYIQRQYGGGRYHFQLQYDGGLKPNSWVDTINDPAEPSVAEQTLLKHQPNHSEPQRTVETSQTFVSPPPPPETPRVDAFQEMKRRLEEAAQIRELLGIPEQAQQPVSNDPHYTVQERIALEMMKNTAGDPELGPAVIKKLLGIKDEKGEKSWADVAWQAFQHLEEVVQVVSTAASVAAPFLGRRPAAPVIMPGSAMVRRPAAPQPPQTSTGIVMPPAAPEQAPPPPEEPVAATPPRKPVQDVVW
jgi:hypothetical protein